MRQKKIQKVIVGADRIATNGDFANKIGTYSLAVLSLHHRVPFFIAAPETTIDHHSDSGAKIPVEQRDADEVRGVVCHSGRLVWSPSNCSVYNPSFDVTPAQFIDGMILDVGFFSGDDLRNGCLSRLTPRALS